ncbi:hypothetical protein [Spongiactinospora sp. TRM90649]|uniref:hypothetical protein n=1 Tax=Spongiactinospora sp. TRM90649 TaxID=3031114 RepID=UPI0023FA36D2|nr:hypothetical protein [Spongiactinospora sp. TRM90649]MDF5758629.1 hypothetical protein [Spongiactinospora sp. TRM90649]
MSPETLTSIGTLLAALLGGGTVSAVLTYVRDRRRDRGEQSIGAVGSLERLNDRLTAQVAELQTALDNERTQRRSLEDQVASERRARHDLEETVETERRARHELEARIALLEQQVADPEGETS